MSRLAQKKLGEILEFKRGYDLPSDRREPGQYPVISSAGFTDFHSQYKAQGEGIVTGRYGTLGDMYFIDGKYWPLNTALYVKDFRGNDPKYIYYLLKLIGSAFASSTTTIPGLNRNDLHELSIPVIENINEQISVREILWLLDRKIKLNNQINSELEAMTKLIYDYWFVQFDFPDEHGKPYKSSGGKMVYSEELKREIPHGWGAGKLGDFEPKIITGKTPSTANKENFEGDIPFICIGDVRGNMYVTKTEITLTEIGAASQASKFIPKGAICVTCIASPGLVAFASSESQTNQQLNSVVCKSDENRYFLYFYLKDYFNFARAKTGNTFANMNKDDFSSIMLPFPKKEVVDRFSETVKSVFEKVLLNSQDSNHLIELRDWLLPMLINGQVTVSETAK